MRYYLLVISVVVSLGVVGCSDATSDPASLNSPLANELLQKLQVASNFKGTEFYVLPESGDFGSLPQDARNRITPEKVELGKMLFHETMFGSNPKKAESKNLYSCASCHHVDAGFQAGNKQGIGEGGVGFGVKGEARTKDDSYDVAAMDIQAIRSPSALNVAYQTNMLWNGQFGANGVNRGTNSAWTKGTPKEKNNLGFDGVETQAIAGQDVHRLSVKNADFPNNQVYKQLFDKAFPELPDSLRCTNITAGLAIAAYERTLVSNRAPFQQWLKGNRAAMTERQMKGAVLFFDKAKCYSCHNGPALNSMEFYALGMGDLDGAGTYGTDASKPENKGRGGFTGNAADMYKFKVPQLYNLADVKFLGHGATFSSVKEIIEYKNKGVLQKQIPAHQVASGFKPLGLTNAEVEALTDFVSNALYDNNLRRYVPGSLPSGLCFPNNDAQTRKDKKFN